MAQFRHYVDVAGGEDLDHLTNPERFNKTTDTDRLGVVSELQGLSLIARTQIAPPLGHTDVVAFDAALEDEQWELQDRLDYYSLYSNRTQDFTVRDGAWFTPDSVDSFCGETGPNVVGNSIDGVNTTFWGHNVDERHSVIYLLRDYPKKITKIRFRYNTAELVAEQLTNLDVHASKNIGEIDNAENILETGINIIWPIGQGSVFVEHTLAQEKNETRYIKLIFDSAHPTNTARIREFAVFVETRDPIA